MMDDRDKAREARMEAHEASIARSLSKLDTMPTQVTLVWVTIGAAVGAIILILGIMQFARSEFWGASQFTASTYEQAHEAKETADKAANDVSDLKRRFEQTNRNLETLNESIKQLSETAHREKTDVQGQVPKP